MPRSNGLFCLILALVKSPQFWLNLISRSIALSLYTWVWSDRTANRAILLEVNFGLARRVAHRWKNGTSEPYNDLEQLAAIGLLKAIERFNPRLGFRFSSYAWPRINGEIQHYIRDKSRSIKIPRKIIKMKKDIQDTRARLAKKKRFLSDRDIAIGLNYTDEDLADLHCLSSMASIDSIETAPDIEFREQSNEDDYQIEKAKIAIASGGIYGLGPGKSIQKNFLPQSSSDFIYAIIVEEYGLIGGLLVLGLYLLLLFRFVMLLRSGCC